MIDVRDSSSFYPSGHFCGPDPNSERKTESLVLSHLFVSLYLSLFSFLIVLKRKKSTYVLRVRTYILGNVMNHTNRIDHRLRGLRKSYAYIIRIVSFSIYLIGLPLAV